MSDITLTNQPPHDELARLTIAAREALTDSMVERLAATGANALELIDRLNDEDTRAAVHALIDRVTELHKVGALDTGVRYTHDGARDAQCADRQYGGAAVHVLRADDQHCRQRGDGRAGAKHALAFEAAAEQAARTTPRGGIFAMLSILSKPEAQRSLAFLLAFGEKLQRGGAGL